MSTPDFNPDIPLDDSLIVAGEHDRDPMAVFQALMSEQ